MDKPIPHADDLSPDLYGSDGSAICEGSQGMTLRDWFAGQTLAGIMSRPGSALFAEIAWESYRVADAMLAERGLEP